MYFPTGFSVADCTLPWGLGAADLFSGFLIKGIDVFTVVELGYLGGGWGGG